MSINRDEALRAKDIAEGIMKKADFTAARRLVLRAQKLDSSLENISHMMMVCDVHCVAAEKLSGNEMDWYGILQVEQKADDISIKKQYKKLAFLLHPDKNKLPGAEAAFKLIGEAQRILLDKEKRSLHDMKRRVMNRPAQAPAPAYRPQQAPTYNTQPVFWTNHNNEDNFTGFRPENQQQKQKAQAQPSGFCSRSFWTACQFCHMKYEYARAHINKNVTCLNCKRQFTTYEVPGQGAPGAKSSLQTTFRFPQQNSVPTQGTCNARQKHPEDSTLHFFRKESFPMSGCTAKGMGQATYGFPEQKNFPNQNPFNVEQKLPQTSSSYCSVKDIPVSGCTVKVGAGNVNRIRKRKKVVESSESSDNESSSDSEEDRIEENGDVVAGQGLGSVGGQQPRRSVRNKRQVSYNENVSDDDGNFENLNQEGSKENGDAEGKEESGSQKQSCEKDGSSSETLPNGKNRSKKSKEKENCQAGASAGNSEYHEVEKISVSRDSKKGSSSESLEEPKLLEYPDPDFNDFDALRKEGNFVVGQIWAVYDTHDGMPRFYACIKKVFTSGFKLSITWLEADPDDDNGISWVNAQLPITVGKFSCGATENTVDSLMFSHVLHHVERNKKPPSYRVLPRKGETWSIFKNWDISWSAYPNSHRQYEYKFVEVLSEYSEAAGVSVALLYKLKGFSCVFCRAEKSGSDVLQILPHELYRFSHSVPSFRLTGKERKGVPEGSYELDPAALPLNTEGISVSVPSNAPAAPVESKQTPTTLDNRPSASNSDCIVFPKTRFKNFEADKLKGKFKVGQTWSLYSKEDGFPKYYAKIEKVSLRKLQICWLESKSLPAKVKEWRDRKMPICCGTFRLKTPLHTLTDVSALSHQIESGKGIEITIIPKNGQVWAMYRKWSDRIKVSDLKEWEYDVVEVLDVNETEIEVMLLERVKGFDTVFKEAVERGDGEVRKTFPISELLRFSHQVPEHRLTEERCGSLRGGIELDPKALPRNLFSSR
ncbi:PREDICTED: uncharacterized protein LOC104827121 [Tarenaya hassleriana]|uniref:uncharacterized protein LOC104827121 n=1 Tax=Tarenaya hassleriana TaxID=28532 RepID=UPI00053C2741|nr:PREDICTED: uncharacterized protein LOC104827121 [Tarenaya hassleriana]XP_010558495.1 PREDICTED: uncharacterized protein LOC104827121 [Tarenaya hassleriana]XP_010558496.1 PREDICTED: uncharacterized protein LOC104827121 [Tarenaya hassleriana]